MDRCCSTIPGTSSRQIAFTGRSIQMLTARIALLQLFLFESQQLKVTGRFALFNVEQTLLSSDQAILSNDVLRARVQQTIVTRNSPLRWTKELSTAMKIVRFALIWTYLGVELRHAEVRVPIVWNDSEESNRVLRGEPNRKGKSVGQLKLPWKAFQSSLIIPFLTSTSNVHSTKRRTTSVEHLFSFVIEAYVQWLANRSREWDELSSHSIDARNCSICDWNLHHHVWPALILWNQSQITWNFVFSLSMACLRTSFLTSLLWRFLLFLRHVRKTI